MWGGFGKKGVRCCATNSPALQVDSSSPDELSKMLVEIHHTVSGIDEVVTHK
jgi:hypothetical protein